MSIERHFDIPLIASLALKEKQIQQNYRPIIAVHKWFARRPGTLFRGLLLSEFADRPLTETFFVGHDFPEKIVADPFMGGGSPLIEANRIGCDILGLDINPMATWIVREEIDHLDCSQYRSAADKLVAHLRANVGDLYLTDCPHYGDQAVPVKYFLWVKTLACEGCGHTMDLFPGYLIAENKRHPRNVIVCADCGELNEVTDLKALGSCRQCRSRLKLKGPAGRNRCSCPLCGHRNTYPRMGAPPLDHRLFAIEYFNPNRKAGHRGRFFKRPDAKDLARWAKAEARWAQLEPSFVPDQEIPSGDESDRLHRWGYRYYRELFNVRQLLGLELSCQQIMTTKNMRVRRALATNLSDLLRYQNMLCRYDAMALKSLDIFSVHGFPVGLVHCESNILGISNANGIGVGSGGWTNIIDKYAKAKRYCDSPFEVQHRRGTKIQVEIPGEWIGERRDGERSRKVTLKCQSSTDVEWSPKSLDAVLTDPPYFGNVQYAELMDFCFAWLRTLAGSEADGFDQTSTRAVDELTVNATEGRGLIHFTEGLARVYSAVAPALKPGAPLAFTYHHNKLEAYLAVGVAILDAGLTCSATLPCPAEMGGSIHIHGTGSSIIDTVFVCRMNGNVRRNQLFGAPAELTRIVRDDVGQLRLAGVKATVGDVRCIVFGHLTRMAIWNLRSSWNASLSTKDKLDAFAKSVRALGPYDMVIDAVASPADPSITPTLLTGPLIFREERDAVAF